MEAVQRVLKANVQKVEQGQNRRLREDAPGSGHREKSQADVQNRTKAEQEPSSKQPGDRAKGKDKPRA